MDSARAARLERVYAAHPLTAAAVLARVRAERGTLDGLRERDLAEAPHGGATDQNHVGGAATVRALAAAVGAAPGWSVLDVGAGLGGASRLLAEEWGCRCHGVELTASRHRDAVTLTRLVGLDDLVSFTQGDFMTVPATPAADLAICLGASMHFADVHGLLDRLARGVRPGGRVVIEDGVLAMRGAPPDDREALGRLEHCWNGVFQARHAWPALLARAGLRLDAIDDLTDVATRELAHLLGEAAAGRLGDVGAEERLGWELGRGLVARGRLAFARLVATRA